MGCEGFVLIKLIRVAYTKEGTFGVLIKDGFPVCVTLEDPWNENKRNISCIPVGVYSCTPHDGQKYKETWKLENVPGRSAILIHIGNTQANTQGCILVGERYGELDGQAAILGSKNAMSLLKKILPTKFEISISDAERKPPSCWEKLLKGK